MTSTSQKRRFYAVCEDFARSGLMFGGKRRDKDDWKVILISGHKAVTGGAPEVIEGLEGELVQIRESLITMDTARGARLIEYAQSIAVILGVELNDPEARSLIDAPL